MAIDLEARLASLERELAAVRAELGARSPVRRDPAPAPDPAPSRRLVLGGAAAGAAAALLAAVGSAEPAGATSNTMYYGTTNDAGGSDTKLSSPTSGNTLWLLNNGSGNAVLAQCANGVGISASGGVGVQSTSTDGVAVSGQSTIGTAGSFSATNGTGLSVLSNRAQLLLRVSGTRGAPPADATAHERGEIVRDSAGDLWCCTTTGTPGTWRKLSGPATAGAFHLLAVPVRIYDSRPGTLPSVGSKTKLTGGSTRTLDTRANNTGVPTGATGVLLTCMVVNAKAGDANFTVWANGKSKPAANTMVWGGSTGRHSTLAVSAVDASGKIKVSASTTTDLVVDVVGYYR